jgi:alcohol dehydrogenase class IV
MPCGEAFDYQGQPHRVLFGRGRLAETTEVVRGLGGRRALVLSSAGRHGLAERVAAILGAHAAGTFAGAAMHTPVAVTEAALEYFREVGADCIVSIGGGSAIGLGKALAVRTGAPHVAVPTTYSGSEVTPILGETDTTGKHTRRVLGALPQVAIYDADLTLTLPARASAASGMNAIAHAIEAMYSPDVGPVLTLMAEEGLRAMVGSLPGIVADPSDIDERGVAFYGAFLCGLALGGASMGLHHRLCHILGGTFGLPHAETHAVLLPHVAAYNAPAAAGAMARIASALGAADVPGGLYRLVAELRLPLGLREIGLGEQDLGEVLRRVLAEPPAANPRALDATALAALLRRAFSGLPPAA